MLQSRWLLTLPLLGLLLAASTPGPAVAQATAATALDSALARTDSLRQAGAFDTALERLQTLRDEHGDRASILWRLSFTQVDRAKRLDEKDARSSLYENALTAANAALQVDSTNAHAHLAKAVAEGRIALDAGTRERVRRSRAVRRHADRAIALDSTLAGAFHVRGRWNREVADLGFFERAIVKTIYGGLPEASFEQAVRDFRRAIALEDRAFHHLELARTYLKMDRPSDARAELEAALAVPNQDPFDPRYKEEARRLLDDLE